MTFQRVSCGGTLLAVAIGACGGPTKVDAPAASTVSAPMSSPAPSTAALATDSHVQEVKATPVPAIRDAGAPEAAAPARPFASTPGEATSLIDSAIDARIAEMTRCVEAARAQRKNPHQKISVEVGIDQQGRIIGVKAPAGGQKDEALFTCVQQALAGANFPTSHAGIITVVKSFEEQAVYR